MTPGLPVTKGASEPDRLRRAAFSFPSARAALREAWSALGVPGRGGVLLPAYIGWSPREGSGIFDPVQEIGAAFGFYRVTRSLEIDLEDLAAQLGRGGYRTVLFVHYFGYPDLALDTAVEMARRAGVVALEDEAHALYSDLVGMRCGRAGAAAAFSLHKMFPVETGGLLLLNGAQPWPGRPVRGAGPEEAAGLRPLVEYDLPAIAATRRRNASLLLSRLGALGEHLELLRPALPDGVVPQTLPVVLRRADRDAVYARMNAEGFGVVSLYHTMVEALSAEAFPDSCWLSRRILNLPVHQDATAAGLEALVERLGTVLAEAAR